MIFSSTCKWLNSRQQNTILSTLQRLRNQHTREGGASFSNSQKNTSSSIGAKGKEGKPSVNLNENLLSSPGHLSQAPPHVLIQHEAGKLLCKTERSQELLTDVLPTSPTYCVEVGKLLSLGAYFGCSTTTPRIADALAWVAQHGESSLLTLRQVMSIATPVTNLVDGKTTGSVIFWTHLMKPLENAVNTVVNPAKSASYEENTHNRNGIISVFQMITKVFSCTDVEGVMTVGDTATVTSTITCDPLQWKRLVDLMNNCTEAIVFIASVSDKATECPVLELNECIIALTAIRTLENNLTPEITATQTTALKSLNSLYLRWMQLLDVSVSNSSTQSTKKSAIVIQMAQLTLCMPSDTKGHRLLQYTLQLLPSALSSSAIKDICALTQLVNRLRQKFGVAVTPDSILRIMDAARPKIILLSEGAHSSQFRHIESSILMGNLSRWEEIVGKSNSAVLSNDLLDILCSRFIAHMDLVWMTHLVPFLQGLCRVEMQRRERRSSDPSFILLSELRLEHCLDACMRRVVTLSQESKCTTLDAAASLRAFTELGVNAEPVFLSVKDILLSPVRSRRDVLPAQEGRVAEVIGVKKNSLVDEKSNIGLGMTANAASYISVVKALELFQRHFNPVTQSGKQTASVLKEVLAELHGVAPQYLREASDASELHSLFNICVREPSKVLDNSQSANSSSQSSDDVSVSDNVSFVNTETVLAFLRRVESLAPQCGTSELASFSLGVSQLSARHPEALSTMSVILNVLQQQSADVPVRLMELKKIMDSTSKMGYTDAASWLSKNMTRSVNEWGLVISERRSWSDVYAALQELTQFLWSSTRVIAVMSMEPAEARSVYFTLLDNTEVLLHGIKDLQLTGENSQLMLSELTFLCFNLSKMYEAVAKLDEIEISNFDADNGLADEQKDNRNDHGQEGLESPLDTDLHTRTRALLKEIGDLSEGLLSSSVHDESGNTLRKIEPKKIVMLIQSFEKCEVIHTSLMYTLLHELRQVAHLLDPLELSLVMNAALGQGVWNARLMQQLAYEVDRKIMESPLRQCHSILYALERSHFFSRQTQLDASQDLDTHFIQSSPLETLARAALKRMNELSSTSRKVHDLLIKESFLDIINSVRVLSFFHSSPQPMLDTFFMVATKRFITFCIRVRQKKQGVALTPAEMKTLTQTALYLLQSVHKVRNTEHQRIASVAIQRALLLLEENVEIAKRESSPEKNERRLWSYLSAREIAELMVALQIQQFFYTPKRSSHTHKVRVNQLYARLMQAYVAELMPLQENPRKIHHALQPLFSPGNTTDLPASVLRNKNLLSLLVNLPETTKTVGKVATLIFTVILNYTPVPGRPSSMEAASRDFLRKYLPIYLEQHATLPPSDAVILIRSSISGLYCETNEQSEIPPETLNRVSSTLLTASLNLSNAVELLLVLAGRHIANRGLEENLKSVTLCAMRMVSPMLTRHDQTGYRTLVQVYRLLTENDAVLIRAFIGADSHSPAIRPTCAELVLQAISVVARAYHSPASPTHSLTRSKLRRICQCLVSAFPDAIFNVDASTTSRDDKDVADVCERILTICDSLL